MGMSSKGTTYIPYIKKLEARTVSFHLVGYSARSNSYKFYCSQPTQFIETHVEFLEYANSSSTHHGQSLEEVIEDQQSHSLLDVSIFPSLLDNIQPPLPVLETLAPVAQPEPVRRSSRVEKSTIHDDYKVYLEDRGCFNPESDGPSYSKARNSVHITNWLKAMEELQSMENSIWEQVPLPNKTRAMECKWVFKTKRDSEGRIERFTTILIAKDFKQREWIDYVDTSSLVSKKNSLKAVLALVAHFDLELHQIDVKTTFLNGIYKSISSCCSLKVLQFGDIQSAD